MSSILFGLLWYLIVPLAAVLFIVRILLPRLSLRLDKRTPGSATATLMRDIVGWSTDVLGWLRMQCYRLVDRIRNRGEDTGPVPGPPRPPAPAPRRPGGPAGPVAGTVTDGPIPMDVTEAEMPPAFLPLIAYVSGFEPDEDADLMVFVRGLAAGDLAMAGAVRNALDHCLTDLGLDPMSVEGMSDYADEKAEHAQGAVAIWQRFRTVYAEVQAFLADGGQLPHDGRFLTGEGA